MSKSLSEDSQNIFYWGSTNLITLNASKNQGCFLTIKKYSISYNIDMSNHCLHNQGSLELVGLSFQDHRNRNKPIFFIVSSAAEPRISLLSSKILFVSRTSRLSKLLPSDANIFEFIDLLSQRAYNLLNMPYIPLYMPM